MVFQDSEEVSFFRDNLVLIAIAALVIFGYLVVIIKKRWKHGFVHARQEDKTQE